MKKDTKRFMIWDKYHNEYWYISHDGSRFALTNDVEYVKKHSFSETTVIALIEYLREFMPIAEPVRVEVK